MTTEIEGQERRKASVMDGPTVDKRQRLVTGFCTTTDVDEIGDVVVPQGNENKYFEKVSNVDLEHDPAKAIGVCRNYKMIPDRGILTTTYIGTHALGEDVMTMIGEGVLRGLSIAFKVKSEGKPTGAEKEKYGASVKNVIRAWKLRAYSFVSQPMNGDCTVLDVKSWDACRGKVDDLLCKGAILRTSAQAVGLLIEPVVVPATGKASGRRFIRASGGGLVILP